MKTLAILTGILMFMVGTCAEHDQMGYPKKVVFPKEGGTQTIRGNEAVTFFNFETDKRVQTEVIYLNEDSTRHEDVNRISWVTIRHEHNTNELTIEVEPSTSSKKRSVLVTGMVAYTYTEIKIEQR